MRDLGDLVDGPLERLGRPEESEVEYRAAETLAGIEQVGAPDELYQRPANLFVARFIGMPEMNLVPPSLFGVEGAAQIALKAQG